MRLNGLFAAPFTPMNQDGSLRLSEIKAGNLEKARQLQRFSVKVVEQVLKFRGGVVAGKAIQSLCGIECGPCRVPLQTLSDREIQHLQNDLVQLDFFKRIAP